MHILLSVESFVMTRFLFLKNTETGTIDKCFDDSDILSEKNFSFMKANELYECKIKLFGKIVNKLSNKTTILCTIEDDNCFIGGKEFVKIKTFSNDVYYILKSEFDGKNIKNEFYFDSSRKDILQVNDIIHPDCI